MAWTYSTVEDGGVCWKDLKNFKDAECGENQDTAAKNLLAT